MEKVKESEADKEEYYKHLLADAYHDTHHLLQFYFLIRNVHLKLDEHHGEKCFLCDALQAVNNRLKHKKKKPKKNLRPVGN